MNIYVKKRNVFLSKKSSFSHENDDFLNHYFDKVIIFLSNNFFCGQPPWYKSMGSGRQRESHTFFVAKILNFTTFFLALFFMKKRFFFKKVTVKKKTFFS